MLQTKLQWILYQSTPDSKVHGANMGPIVGQQEQGGPQVGPRNLDIWDSNSYRKINKKMLYAK